MSTGASSDHDEAGKGDAGSPSASITLPTTLHATPSYARCPHHAGKCPACGEDVKDAKVGARLTPTLKASPCPPDLRDQLDQLLVLADKPDRAELLTGGGQALFARLKGRMPAKVTAPGRPRRPWWLFLLDVVWPLDIPETDAQSVLKRAMKEHWINQACLDAAHGLPLDPPAKVAFAEEGKRLAAFLPLLAEQIYTDKRAKS